MDDIYFKEITSSIKTVYEMVARIDERVKMIAENQNELSKRIDKTSDSLIDLDHSHLDLGGRIHVIEERGSVGMSQYLREELHEYNSTIDKMDTRMHNLETRIAIVEQVSNKSEHKWSMIFDFIYKSIWVIVVCYVLLKLNLNPPAIP